MAFLPYVRVVIKGVLRGTQTWSMGLSVANDGTATGAELFTYLGSVDTFVKAFMTSAGVQQVTDSTTLYQTLAAYSYPAVGGSFATAGLASSGTAGTGSSATPSQCALVLSLRSGRSGRAGRGRMYLPATSAAAMASNGQYSLTTVTNVATAAKTMLDGINTLSIGAAGAPVVIASRASGVTAPVNTVQVDTKIDTQRRRTDKIVRAGNAIVTL